MLVIFIFCKIILKKKIKLINKNKKNIIFILHNNHFNKISIMLNFYLIFIFFRNLE